MFVSDDEFYETIFEIERAFFLFNSGSRFVYMASVSVSLTILALKFVYLASIKVNGKE